MHNKNERHSRSTLHAPPLNIWCQAPQFTVYITQGTRSKMQGVAFRLAMTLLWFFAHQDSFIVMATTQIVSWKWNQQVILLLLKSSLWSLLFLNLGERSAFWGKTCFMKASSFKLKAWNYLKKIKRKKKKKKRKKKKKKKKQCTGEAHTPFKYPSLPFICYFKVWATLMEGRTFMLLGNKNSSNNDE